MESVDDVPTLRTSDRNHIFQHPQDKHVEPGFQGGAADRVLGVQHDRARVRHGLLREDPVAAECQDVPQGIVALDLLAAHHVDSIVDHCHHSLRAATIDHAHQVCKSPKLECPGRVAELVVLLCAFDSIQRWRLSPSATAAPRLPGAGQMAGCCGKGSIRVLRQALLREQRSNGRSQLHGQLLDHPAWRPGRPGRHLLLLLLLLQESSGESGGDGTSAGFGGLSVTRPGSLRTV